jgi:hypothetical protein
MDFKQQVRLVRKVMTLHRIAAFLVHGEPYCGQATFGDSAIPVEATVEQYIADQN